MIAERALFLLSIAHAHLAIAKLVLVGDLDCKIVFRKKSVGMRGNPDFLL